PVYNEVVSLPIILHRVLTVLPDVEKEIVIVDDGSTDGTREWLSSTFGTEKRAIAPDNASIAAQASATDKQSTAQVILHSLNSGKGAALRTGLQAVSGDVIVIQDADLEYDPQDWERFWPLFSRGHADVVYGSRFYGEPHRCLYYHHYLANKVISFIFSVLYN